MIFVKYYNVYIVFLVAVSFVFFVFKKNYIIKKLLSFYPLKKSMGYKLSDGFILMGFLMLAFSLLDIRGESFKHSVESISQDVIILLDESLSMQCEDVGTSRFYKALDFINFLVQKNDYKVSLGLFSDNYEEIIPFTQDKYYIESILTNLKKRKIGGGTNIRLSLQESFQKILFRKKSNVKILILTDAEEQENVFDLEKPENVQIVGVVIGTKEGGMIPLRNAEGNFLGYKEYNKEKVITKVPENSLEFLKKQFPETVIVYLDKNNYPIQEVKEILDTTEGRSSKEDIFYKKNYYSYIASISYVFFILGFLLRRGSVFILYSLLVAMPLMANMSWEEKREYADSLLKENKFMQSKILYEEILRVFPKDEKILFNLATSLLGLKENSEALKIFNEIPSLEEKNKNNILFFLRKKQCNNPQENKDNKDQEKKDSKDKESKEKDNKEKDTKDNKDQENKDKENKDQESKEKDNKEEDNKDNKDQENKEKENKDNTDQTNKEKDNKEKDNKDNKDQEGSENESNYKEDLINQRIEAIKKEDNDLQSSSKKKKGFYGRSIKKDW